MSSAFVKESDNQWLDDISPTMTALIRYLTNENNGVRVYEKSKSIHPATGKEVYLMSNGLSYSVDEHSKWFIVD